jgi:exonuclease SbcD
MKILILGDLHFGRGYAYGKPDLETGINSRLLDYEKTLSNIINYAISNNIELFIFLGDIFETRNPTPQQVVIFYRQLKRLSDANITSYILIGNHDLSKARQITSSLDPLKEINLPKVFIFTHIKLEKFIDSNNEIINILMVPYRNKQCYDKETNDEAIIEMTNEINMAKNTIENDAPILACLHMMMVGTIPLDVGEYGLNELVLPFEMFNGIDVSIAGHIHRSSVLKENPLFIYSGSMECNDFSEREHKKVFLIYDTSKKGTSAVSFHDIPTRKFIDFDMDYSTSLSEDIMDEILSSINDSVRDAVVRMHIKVHETKILHIDVAKIRNKFHSFNVNCISDISISPVISKQLRNQNINDATDDVSAFKHYIASQTNVGSEVLNIGLSIITAEMEY